MDKNEQSKKHILEQGFENITQDGLRFFTVESLASNLGKSKKTIYKYFPTKEILIEKIVEHFTGSAKRKFRSIVESDENPITKFNLIMDFITNKINRVSLVRVVEVKNRYPIVWKKIEIFRISLIKDFASIFIEAQEKGYARKNINMNIVATIYMNIINSTFQPEFFIKNNLAPIDTINLFVNIITQGMFTDEGVAMIKQHNKGKK
jgi:AcrR family transcriptional regulator